MGVTSREGETSSTCVTDERIFMGASQQAIIRWGRLHHFTEVSKKETANINDCL